MKTLIKFELQNEKYFLTTAMFRKNNDKIMELISKEIEYLVFKEVEILQMDKINPTAYRTFDSTYDL